MLTERHQTYQSDRRVGYTQPKKKKKKKKTRKKSFLFKTSIITEQILVEVVFLYMYVKIMNIFKYMILKSV